MCLGVWGLGVYGLKVLGFLGSYRAIVNHIVLIDGGYTSGYALASKSRELSVETNTLATARRRKQLKGSVRVTDHRFSEAYAEIPRASVRNLSLREAEHQAASFTTSPRGGRRVQDLAQFALCVRSTEIPKLVGP